MKILAVSQVPMALAVLAALSGGNLAAQTATKIATINLQQAVTNTQEAKVAMDKAQREFVEPRLAELKAKQQEAQDLQDQLQRGGNTLSQAKQDQLKADITRRRKDLDRAAEDYDADQQDRERELLADFSTKMNAVIDQYARANNIALVLDTGSRDQSGLVWTTPTIDITQAVVEAYDKVHPATVPAGAKTAAPATLTPPPAASKPKPGAK